MTPKDKTKTETQNVMVIEAASNPTYTGDPAQAHRVALEAEVTALQAALAQALDEIETLKKQVTHGRAGYLITTPNRKYTGKTAGVQFRNGQAFLPATDEGEKKARFIGTEFDYKVEYLEDYQDQPEGEQIGKSLIETLSIPHRR